MATERQKRAIDNLVENGGSVASAMREAGYSENTIKTPQKLTESKAFIELADRIPDELLERVHIEGLNAVKMREGAIIGGDSGIEEARIAEPDYAVRHKYLDSAYKLKGSYAPDKAVTINLDVDAHISEADMELARQILEQRTRGTSSSIESNGTDTESLGGEVPNQE